MTNIENSSTALKYNGVTGSNRTWYSNGFLSTDSNIYNNSFNCYTPGVGGYAVYCYTTTPSTYNANNFVGNTIKYMGTSYAKYMYWSGTPAAFTTINYNDIYAPSTTNLAVINTSGYGSSLPTGSYNTNSTLADPQYFSNTDLHTFASALNGTGTSTTNSAIGSVDIDGETRNATTPDIGADEFTPPVNDAGLVNINNGFAGYCAGTLPVTVTLKNQGSATLTSVSVNWILNSTTQTPYVWTGSLANGASATVTIATSTTSTTVTIDTIANITSTSTSTRS
jgi:hypothetical protein